MLLARGLPLLGLVLALLTTPATCDVTVGCTCEINSSTLKAIAEFGFLVPETLPAQGKVAVMVPGLLAASDRIEFKKMGDVDTKIEMDKSSLNDANADLGVTALVAIAMLGAIRDCADGVTLLAISGKLLWELSDVHRISLRKQVARAKANEVKFAAKVKLLQEELSQLSKDADGYHQKEREFENQKEKLANLEIKNKEMADRDKALPLNNVALAWEKLLAGFFKTISSATTIVLLSQSKALARLKSSPKREFVAVYGVCGTDATKKFSTVVDHRMADSQPEAALLNLCANCSKGTQFLKDYCV